MNRHIILCRFTNNILFEGRFSSLRQAAEQAVKDGIVFDNARFAGANLVNAALDEGSFRRADFSSANLMGANISEAALDGACFTDAGLQNACLAFSSLRDCDFSGAAFGATDIAGSDISGSRFSTLSAFGLNFIDAKAMAGCVYADPDAGSCPITAPPVTVGGLPWPVVLLDSHVRIGAITQNYNDCLKAIIRSFRHREPLNILKELP